MIKAVLKHKWFIALSAGYLAVRFPYAGFVPIWDGKVYYWFARHVFLGRFNPVLAETHDHVCFLYTYLMSIPARLNLDSIVPFNCFLALFTLAGIFVLYKILEQFMGERVTKLEIALMAAVFAFHPAVLSSTVHYTLDPGLMIFFLFLMLAFLKERYVWSTLMGVFFIFTKETGLLLLPLVPVFSFLCYPERRNWNTVKRIAPVLLLPYFCFGIYAAYKTQIKGLPLFWSGLGGNKDLFLQLVNVSAFDDRLLVQLIQGFVLNFQWVLTLALVALAVAYFIKFRRSSTQRERRNIAFTTFLFIAVLYLITRFRPYSNPRYLMPFYPIFFLLLFQLTALCIRNRYTRMGLSLFYLVLFIPSLYFTLDPVSMKIFGTFDFGKHKMLKMTSIAKNHYNVYSRDQIVYNLQFTQFHYMQDYIYEKLKPNSDTLIISAWNTWVPALTWPLRCGSYKRTISDNKDETFSPIYCSVEEFREKYKDADEVYYIEYPNVDNTRELKILAGYFKNNEARIFERGGYELKVTRFYN